VIEGARLRNLSVAGTTVLGEILPFPIADRMSAFGWSTGHSVGKLS
jgi:hypothetical protein